MAAKVAAGAQPWKGSWDKLVSNTNGFLNDGARAVEEVKAGGSNGENYALLMGDCAKAYQCALRYHGSGDTRFADKAVYFMNAWASTHTRWSGDSNISLRAGLYGYQFACAAELMRDYSGWTPVDFAAFQRYMIDEFYFFNKPFLNHNETCKEHYWANWELASMASALAIGVLNEDQTIFDHALNYFYTGVGNGKITNLVWYIHPNGLGQWQESGRDQGHTLMGPQLLGIFCEIAWNQGYDLYGYDNNRVLASVEYISKYNTGHDVPFRPWKNCDRWFHDSISSGQRGSTRPGWDLIYNHYVNRMGMSAPYTGEYAAKASPEGGGFNYGGGSWGFDSLGFTTLTHSRDPIASGAPPSALRTTQQPWQVTLSWAGTAYATSYNVKRSTISGGPYTTIATVGAENLFYVDPGLTARTTYYYVVSANTPGGESVNSAQAFVIAVAAGGTTAQAENATRGGAAAFGSWTSGHRGTGWVVPNSGYIEFTGIDGGAGGPVTLAMRYAIDQPNRAGVWTVNGVPQSVLTPMTAWWDWWDEALVTVTLNSGANNTIRIQSDGTNNYAYVDELTVKNSTASPPDTIPLAPENLSATLTGSQIALTWNPVNNANSYNIKRAISSSGPYLVLDNVTGTNFSDSDRNLTPNDGTAYYYVVTALNSAGESGHTNQAIVVPPPSSLTSVGGDGAVTLGWDGPAPGSDLAYFNVSRSTGPDGPYTQIATGVNSSAYTDRTVSNGTAYYYVVTAVNINGAESANSNQAWAIPAPVYQETDGILSVEVENGVAGGRWITGSDTGASNAAYAEVDPAYNWTGDSPEGMSPEYLVVHNLNVSTSGNYRFWFRTYSGNAADDSFFWRIDNGSWHLENDRYGVGSWFSTDSTEVDALSAGNHVLQISYRENGTRLDKFVVQLDSLTAPSGNGPPESTTTPLPSAPTGVGATTISPSRIDLSWAASSGADSYNVKRSTTSGGPYATIASNVTVTTLSDNDLSANTTYLYVISAVNVRGESAHSAEVTATTATAVMLLNPGFEEPAAGKISTGFDGATDIPGWNSTAMNNSGVETFTPRSGAYRAFTRNGDGPFWQTTTVAISEGDHYLLGFYQRVVGAATEFKVSLVAWNGTTEQIIASQMIPATSDWSHRSLAVTVDDASIDGQLLRIKFENTGDGDSSWIGIDDVTLHMATAGDSAPPAAPAGLTATPESHDRIMLTWVAAPDADSYNVLRGSTSGGPYLSVAPGVTGTDFNDVGLSPYTNYHYVVIASNAVGDSPPSSEASAMTESAPITAEEVGGSVLALAPSGAAILTMDIATSVAGHFYQIERSSDLSPQSWENFGDPRMGNGGPIHLEVPIVFDELRRYYRIRISR